MRRSVVVLGGGLSGVATAYTLALAGYHDITVVERGDSLGGLAGSFEQDGNFHPSVVRAMPASTSSRTCGVETGTCSAFALGGMPRG